MRRTVLGLCLSMVALVVVPTQAGAVEPLHGTVTLTASGSSTSDGGAPMALSLDSIEPANRHPRPKLVRSRAGNK